MLLFPMLFFVEKILILGSGPPAQKIAAVMAGSRRRCRILGFVDDRTDRMIPPVVPREDLVGQLENLVYVIDATRPDRIVVAVTEARDNLPLRDLVSSRMSGIDVEDWAEAYERSTGKLAIEDLPPTSVIFNRAFKRSPRVAAFRRGLDVLVGLAGLILTAPLMAVSAIAIKLESRGPVFFVHKRLGYKGRPFDMLKFRTMHPDNGRTSEWVRDNDDRITRVGGILRKYRIDELPQFLNILRGEMTLIGPRPHPVTNVNLFEREIAYYIIRDLVRPGVTGWSQVRLGYANNLEEETEKMRYDLYYIKHQSFRLDLRILLETVRIVLFGRGANEIQDYGTTRLQDYETTGLPDYRTQGQRQDPKTNGTAERIAHRPYSPHPAPRAETTRQRDNETTRLRQVWGGIQAGPKKGGRRDYKTTRLSDYITNGQKQDRTQVEPENGTTYGAEPSSASSYFQLFYEDDAPSENGNDGQLYLFVNGERVGNGQGILGAPKAWVQKITDPTDLYFYNALERKMITAEIRTQLGDTPHLETRNRKKLSDNPVASWELRADKYRIFYEAEEASREVTIVAVGHRENNRLFVRGEEVRL